MAGFDPENPFPLSASAEASYAQAQAHSAEVDAWLGIRAEEIERELAGRGKSEGQQLWIGLPVRSLLTPYTELREILARLAPRPGQIVTDLGAGYGRMGFVIHRHFPGVRFVGYELVAERVREGERALRNFGAGTGIELRVADLASRSFAPEPADFYFLYDYGTREAIAKTLEDLRAIAREGAIVVVARGRASRDAIERGQPWLSQVIAPEHRAHFSIYRSG